jgi:hypothetical protein
MDPERGPYSSFSELTAQRTSPTPLPRYERRVGGRVPVFPVVTCANCLFLIAVLTLVTSLWSASPASTQTRTKAKSTTTTAAAKTALVDQLASMKIVPQATNDKIKDQIIAKQPKK